MNNKAHKHLDFMIIDEIALVLSFACAYYARFKTFNDTLSNNNRILIVVMMLVVMGVSYFYQPYSDILRRGWIKELKSVIFSTSLCLLLTALFLFVCKTSDTYSRLMLGYMSIIDIVISYALRQARKAYINAAGKNAFGYSNSKLLIITNKKNIDKVVDSVNSFNYRRYDIEGICLIDDDQKEFRGIPIVANKDDVLSYVCHSWIDEVLIVMDNIKPVSSIIEGLETAGISTHIAINSMYDSSVMEQSVGNVMNYTVLSRTVKTRTNFQIFMKRFMDICGAIVGLLVMGLIPLFVGPMIYAKSKGPIFYRQERIGLNGRRFRMFKFRSMVMNADALKESLMKENRIKDGMMFKVKDDPRIIPGIGEFIRKTSLDEFPQFINVLLGDMSLVGTRPPTVDEWEKYNLEHRIRMSIKPGITGLWQISGRSSITDFNEVVKLDAKYINEWSLGLDIKILFKTILVLLNRKEDEAM